MDEHIQDAGKLHCEIHTGLLDVSNDTLATRFMPAGLKRRFCVVDSAVYSIYGDKIEAYFSHHGVDVTCVTIPGEECNKRQESVVKILDALCEFGLLRREPIFASGGGCVLDIVGYTAASYQRGVSYARVPTILLAVVDASVGVKCGIDWYHETQSGLKNRVGAFYAPIGALLDKSFIASQDERNIINGTGEIMKLALVRSFELYNILSTSGVEIINDKYQCEAGTKVIESSIEIMLEELGPNLWEHKLERCVDYWHTFFKIIEMADSHIMHGEAVNVDGYFCVVLAYNRGWIDRQLAEDIARCMRKLKLPIWDKTSCTPDNLWKAVGDGIEHRHGKLRMPLVKGKVGQFGFVNDVTREEIEKGIDMAEEILFELF